MSDSDRQRRLDAAWSRHKRGDLDHAYREYQQLLRDFPNDAATLHYLGLLAQQTGHPQTAIELIGRSIALDSSNPRAFNHLGQIHAGNKQLQQAADCFRSALTLDPNWADALNNLANIMRRLERFPEALALYQRALALDPDSRVGHHNLGKLLRDMRSFDAALLEFERAMALDPSNHRACYEMALCLEELGRFDDAVTHYRQALQIKPDHARSLANLLALRSFTPDADLITRARTLAAAPNIGDEERAKLHQGIGKHHDRLGEYERAFSHFVSSNEVQRKWRKPVDAARPAADLDAAIAEFESARFRTAQTLGNSSTLPVFIVGMPRSGTTLVEQILASHPQVFGAGELMEIPRIAADAAQSSVEQLRAAAQRYLDLLASIASPTATRVTDKLPINYRHLGLIASLFPRARVVHCRRDPRDVALSCFIEMFNIGDQDFTDLNGIARAIVHEARLMEHWRRMLPLNIHQVEYARLVADQEGETRRLIEYCGLPWDDRCLSYFATARTVDTPSRWQVRQPIYATSDGRWRNYAQALQPAIAVLQAAGLIENG